MGKPLSPTSPFIIGELDVVGQTTEIWQSTTEGERLLSQPTLVSQTLRGPRRGRVILAFTALALAACESPSTNPTDAAARGAVAVAHAFLEALTRGDTTSLKLHSVPSARLVALSEDASIPPRVTSIETLVQQVQADSGRFNERMWAPQAHVDDRLATVWAPYDFYRDGTFSHCGTDTFDLVRMGSNWKVLSVTYTIQTENCPENPLGTPAP